MEHDETILRGSCLCGGVTFELRGPFAGIHVCHCSLCRRLTGTGSNPTLPVTAEQLTWTSGEDLVVVWERPSGYASSFCRVCGSPAPDANYNRTRYGIPAGLLEDSTRLRVVEHIYVGSKAHWDVIPDDDAPRFDVDSPR